MFWYEFQNSHSEGFNLIKFTIVQGTKRGRESDVFENDSKRQKVRRLCKSMG